MAKTVSKKGNTSKKGRKAESEMTLGDYIIQALETGKDVRVPAEAVERFRQQWYESISPKIDEIRRRNRPTPEMMHLRLY